MAPAAPTVTLDQEINPWEAQSARFDFAAKKLNFDEGLWKLLRTPAREIIVHFPVTMDDGTSRSSPVFGFSTTLLAVQQKAASATRPTSHSTKCAHWPAG